MFYNLDLKEKGIIVEWRWGVVKGLDELLAEIRLRFWTDIVRFGQNLALYFSKREEEPSSEKTQ